MSVTAPAWRMTPWLSLAVVLSACRIDPPDAAGYVGMSASDGSGTSGSFTTGGPIGPGTDTESVDGSASSGGAASSSSSGSAVDSSSSGDSEGSQSTGIPADCGDGVVQGDEECDDGGESAVCDVNCTMAVCGDAVTNTTADEECDAGGESALCNLDCTLAVCGDGITNMMASEACDDAGESATCDADCTLVECGDGTVNVAVGELCDDAGESAGCDVDCTPVECGDGTTNVTAGEECDDSVESATCDDDCTLAVCGDGHINALAGEECEGMELAGATCESLGLGSGALACDGLCAYDTTDCPRVSCEEILALDPAATSGLHLIDVDGNGPMVPFEVFCDMDTDGGGWTELTTELTCTLGGVLFAVDSASTEGIDALCRPFTRDDGDDHTYHYSVPFPPGFSQFILVDYNARANAAPGNTSDIDGAFVQTQWDQAYLAGGRGDISFGAAEEPGPITSFSAEGVVIQCENCDVPYPAGGTIHTLGMESQQLRIGWGEAGGQLEGWFPWWSGTIRVR